MYLICEHTFIQIERQKTYLNRGAEWKEVPCHLASKLNWRGGNMTELYSSQRKEGPTTVCAVFEMLSSSRNCADLDAAGQLRRLKDNRWERLVLIWRIIYVNLSYNITKRMSDYDIGNVLFLSHWTVSTMSNISKYAQLSFLCIVILRCLLLNVKYLGKSLVDIK